MNNQDFLLKVIPIIDREIGSLQRIWETVDVGVKKEISTLIHTGNELIKLFENRSKERKGVPLIISNIEQFSAAFEIVQQEAKKDDEAFSRLSAWMEKIYVIIRKVPVS